MGLRLAAVVAVTAAGAAWLHVKGPMPVVRVTTALDETVPFGYMLTAFPVLGMLVGDWAVMVWRRAPWPRIVELTLTTALVVAVGQARLALQLPISGHALLVGYVLARRALLGVGAGWYPRLEYAVVLGILAAITFPKLVWWTDPVTLGVGLGLGGLLALPARWVAVRTAWIRSH